MVDEPQVILKKRIKLQWSTGEQIVTTLHGLEYQEPYTLTLILLGECQGRIDILKHELANELTAWLAGTKLDGKPALLIPKRIDEAMLNFIKFGRPPNQADIYLWILSRTLITWDEKYGMHLVFGQVSSDGTAGQPNTKESTLDRSALMATNTASSYTAHTSTTDSITTPAITAPVPNIKSRPSSAPPTRSRRHTADNSNDLLGAQKGTGTFKLTRTILGKSGAMSQLPKEKIKGRAAACPSFVRLGWTDDHYRLTNDISSRRHDIEDAMESRRKVLEVSKARQMMTTNTFRKIREDNVAKRSNYNWARDASYEVTNLDRINATITEDIQRQKCQTERTTEHIRWTMAPNGFVNRRGRYTKGIRLGSGALPPDATSGIKDPRLEKVVETYHWDEHGRRHMRRPEDVTPGSEIERALCLLKKAAQNSSMYKLNLKQVFEDMDINRDGFVSLPEMYSFFTSISLKMEPKLIDALFRHFDPNDSGSVHYGEFCWAFFNRRSLITQWKHNTRTLNDRQIKSKLQYADKNGNGILSRKEFAKLLKSFSIKMSDMEIDLLIDRFDKDGDGELDLAEFTAFINAEVNPKLGQGASSSSPGFAARSGRRNGNGGRGGTSELQHAADERKDNEFADDIEAPPRFNDNADDDQGGSNDRTAEIRLSRSGSKGTLHDTAKTDVADYAKSGSIRLTDVVNPAELSQIFAHQARIEAKLGEKYYK
mmetsp:Transcript_12441/g.20216  ORF Transcript_12441/g.20216 Transcript_12441/m.20216 type:complete len:712 (-) Transcript_12441:555-2690(-)|eukprot:CAMPEP_0114415562 /NCGR_PEP_ID=MMETSP0103-20121206/1973_1 /TAXON_ID=37642 ORGANISM="Paraphysomonas imperforata, Strain PA2" /NCGR_SAMPLE_ID=MMETSP0103 /ASSEMBLY_ACC=CAM_ASM_000201 /LENGTH=711 /DNA_ID=CAMNT_0001583749 /DNA_START=89 /DNA_END=2224 /DNA_ORIENTATION=+